jgi:hypothetical protein
MAMDLEEQDEATRTASPDPLSDGTTAIEAAEARELDQRMVARRDQRSSSRASSLLSVSVSDGQGAGANGNGNGAWNSRFGHGLAPQQASGGYRARGLSSGSDISHASRRSSIVSGDSLVLEENEDEADDIDSPWSHSRKGSGDLENAGDETFVQVPAPTRPPPMVILPPLPLSARTRGSKTSLLSQPASGLSSPAFSRRSSELSGPSSARPDQTTFGALQHLPPPARDQIGLASQMGPPCAGPTQTPFGFPPLSSRRRSVDAPSLGPPPVRSTRLSNSSYLGPLDTVPPSPVRASDQEQEASTSSLPRTTERKSKPAPLRIHAQARSESIEIIATPSEASLSESQSSNASLSSLAPDYAGSQPTRQSGTMAPKAKRKDRLGRPRVSRPPQLNIMGSATPHQTLFIFPPSPNPLNSVLSPDGQTPIPIPSTPSTMLLKTTTVSATSAAPSVDLRTGGHGPSQSISSAASSHYSSRTTSISSIDTTSSSVVSSSRRKRVSALPSGVTPTIAAFRQLHFGSSALPSTPTTATAHVEARGCVAAPVAPGRTRTSSAQLLGPLSPMTARPRRTKFGF